MRAQGFVHAQERFFEMDVRRHATAGRLAELFGEDALETDIYVRTMGWRRVAERGARRCSSRTTRAALEAYADGVNAYLADRSPSEIALEYTVLNLGGLDYHPRRLDAGGLARLAQGDGVGPARQHAGRDRPGAHAPTAVGEERARRALPGVPLRRAPRRSSSQGAVVDDVFEQDATERRHPQPPAPAVARRPGAGRAARAGPGRASTGCRPGSAAATGSAATPGWSTASTPRPARRSSPTTRTSASRCRACGCRSGLHCRDRRRRRARSTSRASASPACRA